jgi:hypothetical protein
MRFSQFLFSSLICMTILVGGVMPAVAADIPCAFKAQDDRLDVTILIDKRTIWSGTLEKAETKTLDVPEGAFTVMSRVYNPNLDRKEEIRASAHTNQCKEKQPLLLPLFPEGGRSQQR